MRGGEAMTDKEMECLESIINEAKAMTSVQLAQFRAEAAYMEYAYKLGYQAGLANAGNVPA